MFHEIPPEIRARMEYLEREDGRDRTDGTPRLDRLRQIPPETGRFLSMLAATAPGGAFLEIGTSAGYSTLWLALACREAGRTLTTFESLERKLVMARETLDETGMRDVVDLVADDARDRVDAYEDVAFCFLDAEKELYLDLYKAVVPNLVPGGLLVADNVTSHRESLAPFVRGAMDDPRVDALVVPIGRGELVCRRVGRRA